VERQVMRLLEARPVSSWQAQREAAAQMNVFDVDVDYA
jgi:hypothetical protein